MLINKLYISLSSWMSNRAWRKGNTRLTVANEMHKQNIARHKNQKNSHAKTRKVTYTHIEKNCMQICKYKLETKSVASSSQSPPHTDRNDWFEFATKWKPNCVHISTGCSEQRCNVVAIFHTWASSNSSVSRTTARWRCKKIFATRQIHKPFAVQCIKKRYDNSWHFGGVKGALQKKPLTSPNWYLVDNA